MKASGCGPQGHDLGRGRHARPTPPDLRPWDNVVCIHGLCVHTQRVCVHTLGSMYTLMGILQTCRHLERNPRNLRGALAIICARTK